MRRDLRRRHLSDLGWTIVTADVIYAPGEDPYEASEVWNLATAALEPVYRWIWTSSLSGAQIVL